MEKLPEQMGPVEALQFALQKEIETYEMYQGFLMKIKTSSAVEIFTFLSDQEYKHRLLIEEKIRELTR